MQSYSDQPANAWCESHNLVLSPDSWDIDPHDSFHYHNFSTTDGKNWVLILDVEDFTYEVFERWEDSYGEFRETIFESGRLKFQFEKLPKDN